MTREQKVSTLIQYLKQENQGYASIPDPIDEGEQRRLLRSLMNVRYPGHASAEYEKLQDELLQEEAEEKGIVTCNDIPVIEQEYPCSEIKNSDRISLWRGDITRLGVDAIVNAANSQLLGCFVPCHGCIDNAIHTFAGIQLRLECAHIMQEQGHPEPTGQAKVTPAYNLPSRHIIHTVGPISNGVVNDEMRTLLASSYRSCLDAAAEAGDKSIALCCISTGEFGFPAEAAAPLAMETVRAWFAERDAAGAPTLTVVLNVYKESDEALYRTLLEI